jgi:hypothetical protein
MAENPPSLELIVFKLDLLNDKMDTISSQAKADHDASMVRTNALETRVRMLEDAELKLRTQLVPWSIAASAAIGVAVKLLIDNLIK